MADDQDMTSVSIRPRYEGANIRTWIGFKHLMYVAEEAVIQWFRQQECGPQRLYHEYGLALEIVDSSVQLPALVEIDDQLVAEVKPIADRTFSVRLRALRGDRRPIVLNGRVSVALVRDRQTKFVKEMPADVAAMIVDNIAATVPASDRCDVPTGANDPIRVLADQIPSAFLWSWVARYFHCHYSDHVQHSAYVRALEEVVDRFLSHRGISVGGMLERRGWIPVVSRARVKLIVDAHMEETIHTRFAITEIMKGLAYNAQMDCYVQRENTLVRVATARILHGYAESAGPEAGRLIELDDQMLAALSGDLQS